VIRSKTMNLREAWKTAFRLLTRWVARSLQRPRLTPSWS